MWIDTHCHTKYSYDNWLEPLALIRRAKALGLGGIVVTEHYAYEASLPVEAVARDEGFLVLRGWRLPPTGGICWPMVSRTTPGTVGGATIGCRSTK